MAPATDDGEVGNNLAARVVGNNGNNNSGSTVVVVRSGEKGESGRALEERRREKIREGKDRGTCK